MAHSYTGPSYYGLDAHAPNSGLGGYTGPSYYGLDAHAPNSGSGSGPSKLLLVQPDPEFLGIGRITGTVIVLGAPGRYRVRLFGRVSGRVIREAWSSVDGSYSFDLLANRDKGYTVIAYDHGDTPINASIQDFITPTLTGEPGVNLALGTGTGIPSGNYKISGFIDELGTVGAYMVRLFLRETGAFISETISAANGSYVFENLPYIEKGYTVVAYDDDDLLNAAISDMLTPVEMI